MNTKYKAKIINAGGWTNYDKCSLRISVGGKYHEGDKFEATIDLVNKRFRHCHIFILDSIKRHNFVVEHNCSPDEAYKLARQEGQQWLFRNQRALEKLEIPYEITHWDDWLNKPRFKDYRRMVQLMFNHDPDFKEAVLSEADGFVERRLAGGFIDQDQQQALHTKSIDYLLEEIAVFPIVTEEENAIELYPGKELQATKLIREKNIQGAPKGLYNRAFTRIDFNRRKGLPQPANRKYTFEDLQMARKAKMPQPPLQKPEIF